MERKHPANLFVRECITKALFKLMKNKEYQSITVSAIVRTAGGKPQFVLPCFYVWWAFGDD